MSENRQRWLHDPRKYFADSGLVHAVNAALLLGQPLLLTGEAGAGKTQLAYSLAWELGLDEPLKFETKSTSTARDLFYTYNALGHFQAVQSKLPANPLAFVTYNALGTAILRAQDEVDVARYLPPEFEHGGKRRSVVLIDEVDKAPRDFPNDILNELELLYFLVPEMDGARIRLADSEARPIVVITSNSEKDLPNAFLRRCIYYHISLPVGERLRDIVAARLEGVAGDGSRFLRDAVSLYEELRKPSSGLRKRPSTAELLQWVVALRAGSQSENPLSDEPNPALGTLCILVKTEEDQAKGRQVVERWVKSRK
jgi:MoxR-like ATPase